jgi:hypothetical protein
MGLWWFRGCGFVGIMGFKRGFVVTLWLWVCGESMAMGLWVRVSDSDLLLWWLRGCGFLVAVICGCGFVTAPWLWVVGLVCVGLVWVAGMWWFVVGCLPVWCGWGVWEKK